MTPWTPVQIEQVGAAFIALAVVIFLMCTWHRPHK